MQQEFGAVVLCADAVVLCADAVVLCADGRRVHPSRQAERLAEGSRRLTEAMYH